MRLSVPWRPDAIRRGPGLGFAPLADLDPRSRALADLAEGRYDAAIRRLEELHREVPGDAGAAADLAAALLARGLEHERPADLVEALDRIGTSPSDPASLYNRAIALEALYVFRMSARAWEGYLEADRSSEWAERARRHLARIRAEVERLDRSLGPVTRESVEPAAGAPPGSRQARGVRALGDGKAALRDFRLEAALGLFERARFLLAAADDPRTWEAEAGIAESDYHLQRFEASEDRARRVLDYAEQQTDVDLEAKALWLLLQTHLGRLDLERALEYAEERLALARRIGRLEMEGSAGLGLSRVLDELGDPDEAWRVRLAAFEAYAELGDGERLARTVSNSSFALARQGRFRAAADLASETVEIDRHLGGSVTLADSLWIRAMHRSRAGDGEAALADLEEAEGLLDRFDSPAMRARYFANLRAVEGSILRATDPESAVRSLSQALEHLRRLGYEYGGAEMLLERARALRRLGRLDRAADDLEDAIRLIETQRERIGAPVLRVSFFDLQTELADEAVGLAVERGDEEAAFRIAENAKGVLLRESLGRAPVRSTPDPGSYRTVALAQDEMMITFWALPEELLAWTLRPGRGPELRRLRGPREALARKIDRLAEGIAQGRGTASRAHEVYRALMEAVTPGSSEIERLIIVPDRFTRGVAWALLSESAHGDPLVERYVISVRPTAFDVGVGLRARSGLGPVDSLLAVGDPRTGGFWPPLPEARREVDGLAALFPRATVLVGPDATRSRLLAALPTASVVHLATHFESAAKPLSTRIALAPESGRRTAGLSVAEIARLDLSGVRLAVLSGCATQREGRASLEGTFSAAGAFLAAGVPEAVASLWPVDDRTTAELMVELYPRLLDGVDTAEALREAQLAVARRGQGSVGIPDWAAFQVISLRPSEPTVVNRTEETR